MNDWKGNSALNHTRNIIPQTNNKPLDGVLVVDFSQFLSGPSASLRLADLGARVIKIERTGTGDICRTLYISNLELDGDSSLFHAINRNKESFAADLKKTEDYLKVKQLIQKADVVIQNFRPGVMERLGFDYMSVKRFNSGVVYGEITGYGTEGPWVEAPGQDLLVQSRSGLTWLNDGQAPFPMGLSIADMAAGAHLAQGILAALVRRSLSGEGAKVEVSLMESILDMQSVQLTAYMNFHCHEAFLNSHMEGPSGIYRTEDSYIALGGGSFRDLGEIIAAQGLAAFHKKAPSFSEMKDIHRIIETKLKTKPAKEWIPIFEENNFWCSEVLHWEQLFTHEGFKGLEMIQKIIRKNGHTMETTRCPIRFDGKIYKSEIGSPKIGEDTFTILTELLNWQGGKPI